mmetsp:Transcript_17808/g.53600  ORF Transcript_17808/g.53600 Transcript_17808/m.53600 type:complete len:257 (-) Transcript_17808:13-783(-)
MPEPDWVRPTASEPSRCWAGWMAPTLPVLRMVQPWPSRSDLSWPASPRPRRQSLLLCRSKPSCDGSDALEAAAEGVAALPRAGVSRTASLPELARSKALLSAGPLWWTSMPLHCTRSNLPKPASSSQGFNSCVSRPFGPSTSRSRLMMSCVEPKLTSTPSGDAPAAPSGDEAGLPLRLPDVLPLSGVSSSGGLSTGGRRGAPCPWAACAAESGSTGPLCLPPRAARRPPSIAPVTPPGQGGPRGQRVALQTAPLES